MTATRPDDAVVAEVGAYWPGFSATATVVLCWRPSDPHAVTMLFPRHRVTWVFARELLAEGLYIPVGCGDVRIAPVPDAGDMGLIQVELSSPDGSTRFELNGDDVADFLTATSARIPIGEELLWASIDDALAALLSQDAGGLS
jgi:hypothetical protein